MLYIQFLISTALIIFSGIKLTKYADILSDRLRLGKVWIGVVLLGFVTSLPEAVASLTAVISLRAPNLAIGNVVGSNNFNIVLIALMDMVFRQGSVTSKIGYRRSSMLPAFFAVLLTCVVIGEIFLRSRLVIPGVGTLGWGSVFILMVYFLGMRTLSVMPSAAGSSGADEEEKFFAGNQESLGKICAVLFVSGTMVVVGAMWLANVADAIAQATGLGRTFVGTIFLACVTSLPEMVVTLSAMRMGSFGLAIGNIFGSNMTNMFIVFLCDVFYRSGSIYAAVSRAHVVTAGLGLVLTAIALAGFRQKDKKVFWRLGWDSWVLIILFIFGMAVLYCLR